MCTIAAHPFNPSVWPVRIGDPMAISHELSSEIATALFTDKERSQRELNDLKDMVFKIHSTLERLSETKRTERHIDRAATRKPSKEN